MRGHGRGPVGPLVAADLPVVVAAPLDASDDSEPRAADPRTRSLAGVNGKQS